MYILVSHHSYPVTGAHYRFDRLAKYLIMKRKKVAWVSPYRDFLVHYPHVSLFESKTKSGKSATLSFFFSVITHTISFLRMRKYKPVIIVFGETNLLAAVWIKLITGGKLSIGVRSNVLKRHSLLSDKENVLSSLKFSLFHFFLKIIYAKADQLTVQTYQAKDVFLSDYSVDPGKLSVINNDLPKEFSEQCSEAWCLSKPPKILFIGNATPIKGLDILLSALKKMSQKLAVTVVGLDKHEMVDFESPIGMDISFLGKKNNILDVMLFHDLLVVPSREDQFPNVVLEALALGMPVIGSKVDGIEFMLKEDFALFDPDDINSLVSCLSFVLSRDGYERVRINSELQSERFNFSWEEEYLCLVDSIGN